MYIKNLLCSLFFAVSVEVIMKYAKKGLINEILYADGLVLTPSYRNYDVIFKKIFLLAKYAKTGKVNVFGVLKFDWQL